jgi:hypothetical protein
LKEKRKSFNKKKGTRQTRELLDEVQALTEGTIVERRAIKA